MPELIDRQALKNHLYRVQAEAFKCSEWYVAGAIQSFIDILDKQPTIEQEVRYGQWIDNTSRGSYSIYCSYCGSHKETICPSDYCPSCGAKMGA